MMSVVHNRVMDAVEIHLDAAGAEWLIGQVRLLLRDGDHVHLGATNNSLGLSDTSPYGEATVFRELILNLLPSEAWEVAG